MELNEVAGIDDSGVMCWKDIASETLKVLQDHHNVR
jgi:hypothetical protein